MTQPAEVSVDRSDVPEPTPAEDATAGEIPADLPHLLRELFSGRRGESHVVAIQDYPDPDAISSALAYREIARPFGIESDIVYDGLISHPENLALVNLLEIELIRFTEQIDLSRYDAAVFVDNQGTTTRLTGRLRNAGIPTFAVIDHHDPQDLLDPIFSDVRPLGAAATQFAEYLASGAFLELDPGNSVHVSLATALLHGLHSETSSLIRATGSEYDAAAYLSQFADRVLLERVLCVQKSRGTMETIHAALGRRILRGGLSLAGVGCLRWADRDAIPQAADFLLKEENVKTAIVYGMLAEGNGSESLIGSLRTNDATLAVDAFLKSALGMNSSGRYYGGGRLRAGGFEIELDFLAGAGDDTDEREEKWVIFDRQIRRKLFEAAGLDKKVE
ncbi:MAG: bifunctional oligoribonuclease/PAP phosphatase NrnA [Gemmatimonas sp.]|nr:bifunctional oligoribonuclease/PAP phosphatase NrnA [Gemmatimonas sp.]